MGKWYRLPVVKAALVLLSVAAATAAGVGLVICLTFSDMMPEGFFSGTAEQYEDTAGFNDLMSSAAVNVLNRESTGRQLESDGKYDPDKLVDIEEYENSSTVTGKNESGIAYRLGDLVDWGEKINNVGVNRDQKIVVCQKMDGSYDYYKWNDFKNMVQEGTLAFYSPTAYYATSEEATTAEDLLQVLEDDISVQDYWGKGVMELAVMETISDSGEREALEDPIYYQDAWVMYSMEEEYPPDGVDSILDIVNQKEEWNGELENIMNSIESAATSLYFSYSSYINHAEEWSEGDTNFSWILLDTVAKQVYTNRSEYQDYSAAEEQIRELADQDNTKYVVVCPKLEDFRTNISKASAADWRSQIEACSGMDDHYVFAAAVETTYPIQDVFYESEEAYGNAAPYLNGARLAIIPALLLFLVGIVWLTLAAGRRADDEELHLNAFDRWKTELGAAAVIVPWVFLTMILGSSWNGLGYRVGYDGGYESGQSAGIIYYVADINTAEMLALVVYIALTVLLFLAGWLSLVRRIKGKTVWKNSILRQIVRLFGRFGGFLRDVWRGRSAVWHTVIAFGGFVLVHWVAWICAHNGLALFLMLAVEAVAGYVLLRDAMDQDKIKKGVKELSGGNMEYQIPLEKMRGNNLETAKAVNDIGNGLQRAVEEKMKSERLKTDLITNVSHDIKTPLTSIINYVDLLKRENIDNPKVQEYIRILEEKAQRLKTLTEDVVEASKVSSGNIRLELMDVDLAEMVNQAVGEFSERMEANNLTVVVSIPEQPVVVHVDNRRMWRVLENIFSNAAKYAMPGTRIYVDLLRAGEKVVFTMKNVSAQPLNIKAEELTERFIRGDVSRSTEGSGLGLSIASTLTEMQGGTFEIYLDGDLFKVTITF